MNQMKVNGKDNMELACLSILSEEAYFERWFEENKIRFYHAQYYSDKQIAYSSFCAEIDFTRSNK